MGARASKGPSEAEQRRILQIYTIKQGLAASGQDTHFENLVFESAGNKAVSYYGALKVLEEVGLLAPIRRYAGNGAGAGWAMFLSIGLKPSEIAELNLDNELSYHAKYGMFAFMPNLAQKLGWSPLGKAAKIAQKVLEQRTGNPNLTFKEVNETFGKELCIIATNLTTGSLEYFHPKTTPDVPVVDALVMSATLPGIMKPKYLMRGGEKHYFVDGGVLCNYAIHAFDGWYLSMKKEDSFLSRLSGNLKPPFKGYNDKTLGLVTVSPGDGDVGEQAFLRRLQYESVQRPNTKLARSKGAESQSRWQRAVAQDQVQEAGQRLLERLRNANINGHDQITAADFQRALGESSESGQVDDIELLFGKTRDELTALFEQLNAEKDGKVTFDEFVEVAMQQSAGLRQHLEGGGTTRQYGIKNMPDIFRAVLNAVEGNTKRAFLKEIDIIRSIGVNTDYVGALDPLDNQDKGFLVMQGEAASMAFLLDYTQKYYPQQQMPIYSALPARQNSHTGSVIDPDEMRDYTVPQNLYPTLPPSYESAIGDSDHLRDTVENNWPQPMTGTDGYQYHPEKNPNMLHPNMMPPQPPMPMQPMRSLGPDPWGVPSGVQPNNPPAPQQQQQQQQQQLAHNYSPQTARVHVIPQQYQQGAPQAHVQVLPGSPRVARAMHNGLGSNVQAAHGRPLQVLHAPTTAVAGTGSSHFTVGISGQQGARQHHRQAAPPVHNVCGSTGAVFSAAAQPKQQVVIQARSPVLARRNPGQTPIAVIESAPWHRGHSPRARHVVKPIVQQRHHRQLAAVQQQQQQQDQQASGISHVVYVT